MNEKNLNKTTYIKYHEKEMNNTRPSNITLKTQNLINRIES